MFPRTVQEVLDQWRETKPLLDYMFAKEAETGTHTRDPMDLASCLQDRRETRKKVTSRISHLWHSILIGIFVLHADAIFSSC